MKVKFSYFLFRFPGGGSPSPWVELLGLQSFRRLATIGPLYGFQAWSLILGGFKSQRFRGFRIQGFGCCLATTGV